jgi:hypothetical protein
MGEKSPLHFLMKNREILISHVLYREIVRKTGGK